MKSNFLLLFMFGFTAPSLVAQEPVPTTQAASAVAQQGAAFCSIPTPKSCPEVENDKCQMTLIEHEVEWVPIYDNNNPPLLIGYDPKVTYPGCGENMEDCERDMADVNHCLLTNARTPEANSVPGPEEEKVCFVRRPCEQVAQQGPKREILYPRDAYGNDIYTMPHLNVQVYWAVCDGLAANNDPSPFDINVSLQWVSCTPHNNCQRAATPPQSGGATGGPVLAPTETSR